jgi:hypothetical protein
MRCGSDHRAKDPSFRLPDAEVVIMTKDSDFLVPTGLGAAQILWVTVAILERPAERCFENQLF